MKKIIKILACCIGVGLIALLFRRESKVLKEIQSELVKLNF